ncbi:response regulator [Cylindrospermum sp. FACHB-282]|uniref:response regulator n=1 Tax=Cylindrospermum sp. FACHB-282 TaxID=2692794 RepID=UPI001681D7BD|nr:response regulator [Cylindrospermum sp. FACHB-282]MBD2386945.1 response regulator [Cylindrospermum sp. FACHB-282]
MNFEKALLLVESILKDKTGKELTDPEKQILKAAWENQPYNNISDSLYLSVGYIKDLASLLWKRISNAMEMKITKSNFRYLLEKQITTDNHALNQIEKIDSEPIETHKANVLIVDDLVENLRFLTEILIKRGYKVRSVTNGTMALRTATNNPPDVILLDIKMPDIDGYEVCKAIKNNKLVSEIPVIFLSALDEVIDKIKAFQVGGVDYITKPFHPEEVIARIQTQITIQKQKLELRQAIEQHQQTAEILYQSRALLASLLNNSVDGIAAIQAVRNTINGEIDDFIYLVVNPVFAKLFGEKRETLTGMSGVKNLVNQLNPELFDTLVRVVQTGKPMEKKFYYKNGEIQKLYNFTIVKFGDGCSITGRPLS